MDFLQIKHPKVGAAAEGRAWLRPFWDHIGELEADAAERVALALMRTLDGLEPEWLPRLEAAARLGDRHAMVQAAVGLAFAERQLWGKARQLLEPAAGAGSLPGEVRRRAWRRLATLALEEGDEPRALACERAAAAID